MWIVHPLFHWRGREQLLCQPPQYPAGPLMSWQNIWITPDYLVFDLDPGCAIFDGSKIALVLNETSMNVPAVPSENIRRFHSVHLRFWKTLSRTGCAVFAEEHRSSCNVFQTTPRSAVVRKKISSRPSITANIRGDRPRPRIRCGRPLLRIGYH
jgi:hypothetical protein